MPSTTQKIQTFKLSALALAISGTLLLIPCTAQSAGMIIMGTNGIDGSPGPNGNDGVADGEAGQNGQLGTAGTAGQTTTWIIDRTSAGFLYDIQGGTGGSGGAGGNGGVGGTSNASIAGDGGAGANGSAGANGGSGVSITNSSLTISVNILGGNGGNGGAGGNGGNGGYAVTSTATGGNGGAGGNGGTGGNGGDAISGSSFTINNFSAISGGTGGNSGAGGTGGTGGYKGAFQSGANGASGSSTTGGNGGDAIVSTGNSTINNYGTISGGAGGTGTVAGTDGKAISLAGGNNTILFNGSSVTGLVTSSSGTTNGGDTLNITRSTINGNVTGINTINLNSTATVNGTISSAGTVNINENFTTSGTIGATTVNVASTKALTMQHNITATTLANNGVLSIAEGQSRTITGDYTQSPTAMLRVGASSNTNYGQLTVSGTATLADNANIDVNVNSINTLGIGQTLSSVLTGGTLVSNGFNITDNSALLNFSAIINGNAIDLKAASSVSVVEAVVGNQLNAASGAAQVFDELLQNGGGSTGMTQVTTQLAQMATQKQVADAVESTLPGISGSVAQLTATPLQMFSNVVTSRQAVASGASSGDGFMSNGYLWVKPFGGWTTQEDTQGVTGYKVNTSGIAMGADSDLDSSTNLGFAVAYINSGVTSDLTSGRHSIGMDSLIAKVYSTKKLDDSMALNLQAGIGMSRYNSERRVFTNDVANANYDSKQIQASAELERTYPFSEKTTATPYVSASYSHIAVDGYNEKGAGALNLNVGSDTANSLILGAGVKARHALSDNMQLLAKAGVGYDTMAERSKLTASFEGGGAQFTTVGIKPDAVVYNAHLGVQYHLENGTEITASYNYMGRDTYRDESVNINMRWMY